MISLNTLLPARLEDFTHVYTVTSLAESSFSHHMILALPLFRMSDPFAFPHFAVPSHS